MPGGRVLIATTCRAGSKGDLLYLYPEYDTSDEIKNLRLDEEYIATSFDWPLFGAFGGKAGNKSLESRVRLLETIYR
jgi:hypothetical protein